MNTRQNDIQPDGQRQSGATVEGAYFLDRDNGENSSDGPAYESERFSFSQSWPWIASGAGLCVAILMSSPASVGPAKIAAVQPVTSASRVHGWRGTAVPPLVREGAIPGFGYHGVQVPRPDQEDAAPVASATAAPVEPVVARVEHDVPAQHAEPANRPAETPAAEIPPTVPPDDAPEISATAAVIAAPAAPPPSEPDALPSLPSVSTRPEGPPLEALSALAAPQPVIAPPAKRVAPPATRYRAVARVAVPRRSSGQAKPASVPQSNWREETFDPIRR